MWRARQLGRPGARVCALTSKQCPLSPPVLLSSKTLYYTGHSWPPFSMRCPNSSHDIWPGPMTTSCYSCLFERCIIPKNEVYCSVEVVAIDIAAVDDHHEQGADVDYVFSSIDYEFLIFDYDDDDYGEDDDDCDGDDDDICNNDGDEDKVFTIFMINVSLLDYYKPV
ncbi:hypothetical protein ElyMa_007032600 [Elysia marginata]|uniref:Uncharacterized protein n=1 Tax=Elysia marginata TaxID=1093978 RepID=A0AAV4JSB2_9GAST|nr:hypothetical protein ElyMa_007032600 [Elysia marginata]